MVDDSYITWAILDGKNRVIQDHGTSQIFSTRKLAEERLAQSHIRAYFEQQNQKPVRVEKVKIGGTIQNPIIEIQRQLIG